MNVFTQQFTTMLESYVFRHFFTNESIWGGVERLYNAKESGEEGRMKLYADSIAMTYWQMVVKFLDSKTILQGVVKCDLNEFFVSKGVALEARNAGKIENITIRSKRLLKIFI